MNKLNNNAYGTSTDATCAVNNYSDKTINLSDNATIRYHNVMTQAKVPDTGKSSQDIAGKLKQIRIKNLHRVIIGQLTLFGPGGGGADSAMQAYFFRFL